MLESAKVQLAVVLYNRQGTEGQTSHSEGGVSRTMEGLPEDIRKQIAPYRLARIVKVSGDEVDQSILFRKCLKDGIMTDSPFESQLLTAKHRTNSVNVIALNVTGYGNFKKVFAPLKITYNSKNIQSLRNALLILLQPML